MLAPSAVPFFGTHATGGVLRVGRESRELNTEPLDPEYETGEPDRARGGNETD